MLSQPNLVCGCGEQFFEVIDQHDDLVDELLQFGSMIDSPARGFQERRAILLLYCQVSRLIVKRNDTRVRVTGRICRILSTLLRDLFGICEESNNLEQRILCSLDLRRRCFRAPELVIAVHADSLSLACGTKSRVI